MTFYKILFESLDNLSLENKYIINFNYNNCYINSRNIINYSDVLVKEIQTNSKNIFLDMAFEIMLQILAFRISARTNVLKIDYDVRIYFGN